MINDRTVKKMVLATLSLAILMAGFSSQGLTMDELRAIPNLTPRKFVRQFSEFRYEHTGETQLPGMFLLREAGDASDFALVASMVFAEKGYHPRLISVRMNHLSYVVCYLPETRSFIDFNNRSIFFNTTTSDGSLADVARKVARSFGRDWNLAEEFTFVDESRNTVDRLENPRTLVATR